MLTGVIYECLILAFLGGCDQIPDEALYLVIAFVVSQAVNQKSPTQQKGNVMCRTLATANKQLIMMIPLTGNIEFLQHALPTDHLHVSLCEVPFKPTMV